MTSPNNPCPVECFLDQLDTWDGTAEALPTINRAAAEADALIPVDIQPSRLANRPELKLARHARARLLRRPHGRRLISAIALVLALALAPTPGARLAAAVRALLDLLAEELAE